MRASIESLALEAPTESVGRPPQAAHANAMIDGIAPGVARDDNVIARLQRLAGDALTGQRTGAAPLDTPALHLAVFVGSHHVDPGMRIPEHELNELAFDLHGLVFVVVAVNE